MRRALILLALSTLGVAAVGATASAQPYDDGYTDYVVSADTVEVYAGDGWYPAQILQVSGNSYLVHYLNSPSEYDEWVDASQVRAIAEPDYVYVVDQPVVQYYWGTTWVDARIYEVRGGRYRIYYNGRYAWVPRSRLYHGGRAYRPVFHARPYRARSFARSARWGHPGARRGHAPSARRGHAPARRGGAATPARRGGAGPAHRGGGPRGGAATPPRRGGAGPAHRGGGSRGGFEGNRGRGSRGGFEGNRGGRAPSAGTPSRGGNNRRGPSAGSAPSRRGSAGFSGSRGSRGGSRGSAAPRGSHGGGRRR